MTHLPGRAVRRTFLAGALLAARQATPAQARQEALLTTDWK